MEFIRSLFKLDLQFDRDVVSITILSTLLIIIDYYYPITPVIEIDRLGLYLLIPLGAIVFAFRQHPREYGFTFGDWKAGVALTLIGVAIAAPILWFTVASNEPMQWYYGRQWNAAAPLLTFLDLFGWEFFFRGFILFGYARVFKDNALWLHAVPFALAHLGKPDVETLSTIFGGFVFGLVAWRSRSFLYAFLIHWFVNTFVIWVAAQYLN
ncbi:MAG: CPBP family intramembrane metalloprotease [Chloroflexi bacterium]|nr:MAG: CPBP family intramembrane metalloprotease [Chloroflexota bacterium]MBL1196820.1 CPBP family intramembrane metalloprotease [Chloroflexota bacterium]NOH14115.1 CPBP family intramembrane metalloprotease [Chloroflexota bacterium]